MNMGGIGIGDATRACVRDHYYRGGDVAGRRLGCMNAMQRGLWRIV